VTAATETGQDDDADEGEENGGGKSDIGMTFVPL
jgi:hypothetical protein